MKKVIINPDEARKVEKLFITYRGYQDILSYMMNNSSDTDLSQNPTFARKWAEAIELHNQLEEAKNEVDRAHRPEGNYDGFEFIFSENAVIYK